jgi:hypothetical protein
VFEGGGNDPNKSDICRNVQKISILGSARNTPQQLGPHG